jgi:hypothetical protein
MFKKILLVFAIVLVIIQFIHPARNISKTHQPNNIANGYDMPVAVRAVLDKACMDCHSNNTHYLWYFKFQPVDWWLTHHINKGKRELNFDEYMNKPVRYQYHELEFFVDQVKKKQMPLASYTWIHKDAILTEKEKNTLTNWAESIRNEIKSKYPADSFRRRRE